MEVYKKLQEARTRLHKMQLNKSGKNSFAKFQYFELGDFIPQVTEIFNEIGLCGVFTLSTEDAYLTVYDVEGENSYITFRSPVVHANMDRVKAIQNLGSTHTYMRRYLWLMAMDIVEHDAVDAVEPQKSEPKPKAEVKAKVEPKPEPKPETEVVSGKDGEWQITVSKDDEFSTGVTAATNLLIELASKKSDINAIFKVNRVIYDQLKEQDKVAYDEIMTKFKTKKESLGE